MSAWWRIVEIFLLALWLLQSDSVQSQQVQIPYPNELGGFKFYSKYLAPLLPGVSDARNARCLLDRVRILGWKVGATYSYKSGAGYNPTLGPLYQIALRPDGIIPMHSGSFPSAFKQHQTCLSELNICFEVYADRFGLEYWLHQADSKWGSTGDLYRVVYGPKDRDPSMDTPVVSIMGPGRKPNCSCANWLSESQMAAQVEHVEMAPFAHGVHLNEHGIALIETRVGSDGSVQCTSAIAGHPLAMAQLIGPSPGWHFKPYVADGVAREFCGRLRLKFSIVDDRSSLEVAPIGP